MKLLRTIRDRSTAVLSDGRGSVLFAISIGWFLSIGLMTIYPILLPEIRVAYDIDLTTAGFLVAGLWVVYGLGQLPAGLLSDRIGEGRVMVLSTLAAGGAVLFVVYAQTTIGLFLGTMLVGLGTSLFGTARFTAMNDIFPDNVGVANGVADAAADGGQALLPVIAGFVTAWLGWQYGLGFTVPLLVVAAVVLWMVLPPRTGPEASTDDLVTLEGFRSVLRTLHHPALLYGGIVFTALTAVWMVFMAFYPTYLIEENGLTAARAGLLYGLYFGLGVAIKPLTGVLYDSYGVRRPLFGIMALSAVALVLVPLVQGFAPLVLVTIAASSILAYNPVIISHLTNALPDDIQGSGLGVIRTIAITIGGASPTLFGAIADRGFFDHVFFLLGGLLLVMLVPLFRIPDRY
ncbi:MFS transporter [Halobacteria archaeon AArc-curdl1]|uniref:MFS transporter n=1 Tax=Natronosalvus hydrolyticus TaxID=2979988 RepID=A0AAP2Z9K7_9EURY|nr:MFS transporter [Halobacteria archaeon AArc-curdl1]